jgi:hypothetical protein
MAGGKISRIFNMLSRANSCQAVAIVANSRTLLTSLRVDWAGPVRIHPSVRPFARRLRFIACVRVERIRFGLAFGAPLSARLFGATSSLDRSVSGVESSEHSGNATRAWSNRESRATAPRAESALARQSWNRRPTTSRDAGLMLSAMAVHGMPV